LSIELKKRKQLNEEKIENKEDEYEDVFEVEPIVQIVNILYQ
jgi:hypothetical protein